MLAVALQPSQVIDIAVISAGAVVLVGWVQWMSREDHWRDPLAHVRFSLRGPTLIDTLVVASLFFATMAVLQGLVLRLYGEKATQAVGSHAWRIAQVLDITGRCVGIVAVLAAVWVRKFVDARSIFGHGANAAVADPAVEGSGTPPRSSAPAGLRAQAPGRAARSGGLRRVAALAAAGMAAGLLLAPLCDAQADFLLMLMRDVLHWRMPEMHPVLSALRDDSSALRDKVLLCANAAFFAPLAEELFFRGMLLSGLLRATRRRWLSIAIAAGFFGLSHLGVPYSMIPLATMGVVLGFVRVRTGSLLPCIVAHALFNGITLVRSLAAPDATM